MQIICHKHISYLSITQRCIILNSEAVFYTHIFWFQVTISHNCLHHSYWLWQRSASPLFLNLISSHYNFISIVRPWSRKYFLKMSVRVCQSTDPPLYPIRPQYRHTEFELDARDSIQTTRNKQVIPVEPHTIAKQ